MLESFDFANTSLGSARGKRWVAGRPHFPVGEASTTTASIDFALAKVVDPPESHDEDDRKNILLNGIVDGSVSVDHEKEPERGDDRVHQVKPSFQHEVVVGNRDLGRSDRRHHRVAHRGLVLDADRSEFLLNFHAFEDGLAPNRLGVIRVKDIQQTWDGHCARHQLWTQR